MISNSVGNIYNKMLSILTLQRFTFIEGFACFLETTQKKERSGFQSLWGCVKRSTDVTNTIEKENDEFFRCNTFCNPFSYFIKATKSQNKNTKRCHHKLATAPCRRRNCNHQLRIRKHSRTFRNQTCSMSENAN